MDTPLTPHEQQLLDGVLYITRAIGLPLQAEGISAEVHNYAASLSPEALLEAAPRLGLKVTLKELNLSAIGTDFLPLLLVENDTFTVLTNIDHQKQEATLLDPSHADSKKICLRELKKTFSGTALIIKPLENYDQRAETERLGKSKSKWFWGTLLQFSHFYKHVILASLLINLFVLAFPLFVMNVYDRVVPNSAIETLWALASGLLVVFIFEFILKTLRAYFIDTANKKFEIILSTRLLKKSISIPMANQPASASVRANHLKEFDSIRDFFSSLVLTGAVDFPFAILFLLLIGYLGGAIAIIPLGAMLIGIVLTAMLSIPLRRYINELSVGGAQKTAIIHEALNSVETVKTHVAYGDILYRWRHYSLQVSDVMLKSRFFTTLALNLTNTLSQVASMLIIIWGVYRISNDNLTIGGLIACTILVGRCLSPLAQITTVLIRMQHTRVALDALNDIMALSSERPDGKHYPVQNKIEGSISFKNVGFYYSEKKGNTLENVSFNIKPGEKVALLGNMGSGKSTLLKLILGLYHSNSGIVQIDGIDVEQWDPHHLRRSVNYLNQNPDLLFGSALYNLTLRYPHATADQIQQAITIAGLNQLLSQDPDGINMMLDEQGKGLSGGQKQAFALARSFIGDSKVILLDEPTSEMDHNAEKNFLRRAPEFLKDKTLLLVTHKQSLLSLVDRIIVLQNGTIAFDDSRENVLQQIQAQSRPASEDPHA